MLCAIIEDGTMCGMCADECPADAINEGDDLCRIDQEAGTECGTCAEACASNTVLEQ